jgi:MATE family multidrug resistance protein
VSHRVPAVHLTDGTSLVYWSSNQSEVNQHCIDWTSTYGFFSAYYIIGIPLGLWLTFKQNMELSGLWYGLTAALVYGSALGIWLSLTTNWNKEVAKVIERLAVDKKFRGQVDHERLRD